MSEINRTKQLLMAKALGFTNSITKLSREERLEMPSVSFGEDYNRLRSMVADQFPVLTQFLPPNAVIIRGRGEFSCTDHRHGELLGWCEQLYQLLDALGEVDAS